MEQGNNIPQPTIALSNRLDIANLFLASFNFRCIDKQEDIDHSYNHDEKITNVLRIFLDQAIKTCLAEFFWHFAMKSAPLVEISTGGYQYPDDCLKLVGLGEKDDCCVQAFAPFVFTTGTNLPTNLHIDLNAKIGEKKSNKYIQQVSFDIINGNLFYNVNDVSPICCDYNYKLLYYIHKNIDIMPVPDKFKELVMIKLRALTISNFKPDPSGELAKAEGVRYTYELRRQITQEYEEFKVKVTSRTKYNRTDVKNYSRFIRSPFRM